MDKKPTADPNNIREMNLQTDLDQICEIWLKGINETAPPLKSGASWKTKLPDFRKETQSANEKYIYVENGIIKGFITANKNYLLELYIDSNFRGKGIGIELLDKIRKIYRYLDSHVYEHNTYLKFYLKHGFEVIGKHPCPDTGKMKLIIRW